MNQYTELFFGRTAALYGGKTRISTMNKKGVTDGQMEGQTTPYPHTFC